MSIIKIKKYGYIDALRGLAIILVIVVHTSQRIIPSSPLALKIMSHGDKGVQLFYLISAFTLCLSLQSRRNKESQYILYFFIRRFFRIAPLFYIAILYYLYPYDLVGNYYAPNGIRSWYIIATGIFMHGWHPETINSIVPGGWSIAVEFTFYLILPFIFIKINNRERAILLLIFSIVINSFISRWIYGYWSNFYAEDQMYLVWGISYYGFFNQLPIFATGILLFHFYKESQFNHKKLTSLIYIFLSGSLMFVADHYHQNSYISKLLFFALAFALLTYALANYSFSFFVNPITKFIGKISYSMYFIHFTIINYLNKYDFLGLSKYKTLGTILAILIVVLFSMILATLTYNLIEKNGIALGRYLIARIEDNGTPAKNKKL